MRYPWIAITAFTCILAPPIQGNTKLLVQIKGRNSSTNDIADFARRAIAFSNVTGITITVDDVNECESLSMNTCSEYATCTNTEGSFICGCLEGFIDISQGSQGRNCTDVDECSGNNTCSENAACQNGIGNYSCTCNLGYQGDGTVCQDIDECEDGTESCARNATCQNTVGSYVCTCGDGYTGDGFTCSDIDECRVGTANCAQNATCVNTDGSFSCMCDVGYTGNGSSCSDIDECELGAESCAQNATCKNIAGSHVCTCDDGYAGDGFTCSDIDECKVGSANCAENATCTNSDGSFSCTCDAGYTGDGLSCAEILPMTTEPSTTTAPTTTLAAATTPTVEETNSDPTSTTSEKTTESATEDTTLAEETTKFTSTMAATNSNYVTTNTDSRTTTQETTELTSTISSTNTTANTNSRATTGGSESSPPVTTTSTTALPSPETTIDLLTQAVTTDVDQTTSVSSTTTIHSSAPTTMNALNQTTSDIVPSSTVFQRTTETLVSTTEIGSELPTTGPEMTSMSTGVEANGSQTQTASTGEKSLTSASTNRNTSESTTGQSSLGTANTAGSSDALETTSQGSSDPSSTLGVQGSASVVATTTFPQPTSERSSTREANVTESTIPVEEVTTSHEELSSSSRATSAMVTTTPSVTSAASEPNSTKGATQETESTTEKSTPSAEEVTSSDRESSSSSRPTSAIVTTTSRVTPTALNSSSNQVMTESTAGIANTSESTAETSTSKQPTTAPDALTTLISTSQFVGSTDSLDVTTSSQVVSDTTSSPLSTESQSTDDPHTTSALMPHTSRFPTTNSVSTQRAVTSDKHVFTTSSEYSNDITLAASTSQEVDQTTVITTSVVTTTSPFTTTPFLDSTTTKTLASSAQATTKVTANERSSVRDDTTSELGTTSADVSTTSTGTVVLETTEATSVVNATLNGTTATSPPTYLFTGNNETTIVTTTNVDGDVTDQTNVAVTSKLLLKTTINENASTTNIEQTLDTTLESTTNNVAASTPDIRSDPTTMKVTTVETTTLYTIVLPTDTDPVELIRKIEDEVLQNNQGELKLNPAQANGTITTFQKLLSDDNVTLDENIMDTVFETITGFSNGALETGGARLDASVGARMTTLVEDLLEVMEIPVGSSTFRREKETVVMEARDVNINDIPEDTIEFQPSTDSMDRGISLPVDFIRPRSPQERNGESPDNSNLRLAFAEYSDGRLFLDKEKDFVRADFPYTPDNFPNSAQVVNSAVLGASVAGLNIQNSSQQVTIRLQPILNELRSPNDNGTEVTISFTSNPVCVWWNYDTLSWSEDGCELAESSGGSITCKCNHLTSFAVIMSVEKTIEDPVLLILSFIGSGLSIFGLLWTILTYSIFSSLRKHRSKKLLLHFCTALCGVYITYLLGIAAQLPSNQAQCIVSGFFLHFLSLSVMAWMSVEVFDMYFMFVKVMWHSFHKYMLKAGLIAWLTPFLVALITLGAHLGVPDKDIYPIYEKGKICWLGQSGMLYAFIIPSCILLFTNLILFAIVLYHVTIKRNHSIVNRLGKKSTKKVKAGQHVANALALLLLAGPTWIIGYFINIDPVEDGVLRRTLSYVFVILNAFQGFWIFVVFSVRPLPVRRRWMTLITKGKLSDISTISSTSGSRHTRITKSPLSTVSPPPRDLSLRSDNSSLSCGSKQPVQSKLSSNSSNSDSSNAPSSIKSLTAPLTEHNDLPVAAIRTTIPQKLISRKPSVDYKNEERSIGDKTFADSSSSFENDVVQDCTPKDDGNDAI